MNSIHGHEVIALVGASREGIPRQDLQRQVEERFGAGCRFHTCSFDELGFAELLEVLMEKGKIAEIEGRFQLGSSPACAS